MTPTQYHKNKESKGFLAKNLYFPRKSLCGIYYPQYSSETVNLARPLARRAANTLRPLAVAILERKPCLFFLFLLDGWNVLFIFLYNLLLFAYQFGLQR